MGIINPSLPVPGLSSATEDPKILEALTEILGVLNGGIESSNLAAGAALAGLAANSVTDAKLATKTIRGTVLSNGTKGEGSGFTTTRSGPTGSYVVTFTTAFSGNPIVAVTPYGSPINRIFCQVTGRSSTTFGVEFLDAFGAYIDAAFGFIAVTA